MRPAPNLHLADWLKAVGAPFVLHPDGLALTVLATDFDDLLPAGKYRLAGDLEMKPHDFIAPRLMRMAHRPWRRTAI